MMLLAGDVGGTKTLVGLFDPRARRPHPIAVRAFHTMEYGALAAIVAEFVRDPSVAGAPIRAACFGVAGPVLGDTAELTNVPWRVETAPLAKKFGFARVDLLNDLQAMAYGVTVLEPSEVHVLRQGDAVRAGSVSLIAAGTGLGEAFLHNIEGRLIPAALEGGHADFSARNEREIRLLRWLLERNGRAEVEDVVSGRGLVNIHQVAHNEACTAIDDLTSADAPAAITKAGLDRTCRGCVDTLEMFVDAYGAEAGNLALRMVTTGGAFVGGGIAPKILPALTDGRFLRAFTSKPPFDELLSKMPVKVILNNEIALVGAALFAARPT